MTDIAVIALSLGLEKNHMMQDYQSNRPVRQQPPGRFPNESDRTVERIRKRKKKQTQRRMVLCGAIAALAVIIVGIILLAKGCSGGTDALAGTWEFDGTTTYSFDGSGSGAMELPSISYVFTYEPVFLYLMAQKDIVSKRTETNRLKSSIESGKRRIQDLDKLIERIYEDQVLGNISAERYARMSVNYENEQRELVKRVDEDEKRLVSIEQTSLDLKTLLKVLRSNTAFEELTPTLVNSLIRRIEVHNNDKSSGHCSVKVDIYFTAIGLIDIPTEDEIKSLMEKIQSNPQEYRLTA